MSHTRPIFSIVRGFGCLALLLLACLPVLGDGERAACKLYLIRKPTPAEAARLYTGAKFEPKVGCYLGAFIDFDSTLTSRVRDQNGMQHCEPSEFEKIVDKPHAMYFFYLGYGKKLPLEWVRELGRRQKFVHIALEPNNGLKQVKDDAYLRSLADAMAGSGAKIFLRFASEMNGTWTRYHGNAALYRAKFKMVHDVMHRRAPNVALVWCPYATPRWNIKDYYPGDAATDWVGVNMYSVVCHNNSLNQPSESEHPCDLLDPIYRTYAARKPIMICEFAATHYSDVEGRPRGDFAVRKISTLYMALARAYPRVKCINYFDGNASRFTAGVATNNYSVTDDPGVLDVYRYLVSFPYMLSVPEEENGDLPAVPMPFRNGELLKGSVRLTCWARAPSDVVSVRYIIDGWVMYKAAGAAHWDCVWDAGSIKPGRHRLVLEARNGGGKVVARQTVTFITE